MKNKLKCDGCGAIVNVQREEEEKLDTQPCSLVDIILVYGDTLPEKSEEEIIENLVMVQAKRKGSKIIVNTLCIPCLAKSWGQHSFN